MPFMREMLYEAIYWRPDPGKPSPEEGLAALRNSHALVDWGERDGDLGVIALVDSRPAGAAWYRFYTELTAIRGYIEDTIPVLVIAVHRDYQRLGIGESMINWLIDHACEHKVKRISLMVSKDNHALDLYRKCGFLEYAETEDSLIMVRESRP